MIRELLRLILGPVWTECREIVSDELLFLALRVSPLRSRPELAPHLLAYWRRQIDLSNRRAFWRNQKDGKEGQTQQSKGC